jgi:hypothetical protein
MSQRVVPASYAGAVTVKNPMNDEAVTLHVWQNILTGNMVAIDNMQLNAGCNSITDPYTGELLTFHDTFTGLPK